MFLPQPQSLHVQRMQTATMLLGSMSPPPLQHPSSPVQDTSARMPLKFGMDRILSEDTTPRRRTTSGSPSSSPGAAHCLHEDGARVQCGEGGGVPCSDCVSSLLRCCSVSAANTPLAPTPTYAFYPTLHHFTASHHGAPPPHLASMFSTDSSHLIHSHPHASKASASSSNNSSATTGAGGKRKRSWSRAVFSNLQRKGLEKRFQLQKYITKPDRRQLAATLGLTDAQVKVWFQNRRMKWRHSKEAKQQAVAVQPADSRGAGSPAAVTVADVEAARRAADSTQLSSDPKTDDESDIDIEVDS